MRAGCVEADPVCPADEGVTSGACVVDVLAVLFAEVGKCVFPFGIAADADAPLRRDAVLEGSVGSTGRGVALGVIEASIPAKASKRVLREVGGVMFGPGGFGEDERDGDGDKDGEGFVPWVGETAPGAEKRLRRAGSCPIISN